MVHEKILANAGDYKAGRLGPAENAEIKRHLAACADCRALVGRWSLVEPSRDLADGVMAGILGPRWSGQPAWLKALSLWGSLAAAILICAAFWHPEASWIKADLSFAWNDHSAWATQPSLSYTPGKGCRYE